MYSPSVKGFLYLTISQAAAKLAAVVEFGDLIYFLKVFSLSSPFRSSSEIALFLSSPAWYFSANAVRLFWKCLSHCIFGYLLFSHCISSTQ